MNDSSASRSHDRLEKSVLRIFDLALVVKFFGGALETAAALLVLLVPPNLVLKVATFFTGGEVGQDPDDPVAFLISSAAHSFAIHKHYFLATYLALHGLVKLVLVTGIFMGKRIAYVYFMGAVTLFALYELYRGVVRHETLLLAFAAFDFLVFLLTAYEYRRRYPGARASDTPANSAAQ